MHQQHGIEHFDLLELAAGCRSPVRQNAVYEPRELRHALRPLFLIARHAVQGSESLYQPIGCVFKNDVLAQPGSLHLNQDHKLRVVHDRIDLEIANLHIAG